MIILSKSKAFIEDSDEEAAGEDDEAEAGGDGDESATRDEANVDTGDVREDGSEVDGESGNRSRTGTPMAGVQSESQSGTGTATPTAIAIAAVAAAEAAAEVDERMDVEE